jgi:hypothetical protein
LAQPAFHRVLDRHVAIVFVARQRPIFDWRIDEWCGCLWADPTGGPPRRMGWSLSPARCAKNFLSVKMSQMRTGKSAAAAVAAGQLVSGVGLHDPHGLLRTCPDRLALSSGTRPASSLAPSGYRDTAFVPRGPWRDPSSQEQRLLLAAEPPVSIGCHITLVRAPDEVMAHFAALRERVRGCNSLDELRGWLHDHPCTTGCDAMLEFAQTYLRSEHPLMEEGAIVCRAPGLPTATPDGNGAYIGLHLDSRYRAKLAERANAPNRLSINLGVTTRFFLYINLPLATIGALADEQDPFDSGVRDAQSGVPHGLPRLFLSHFGSYPVVRVRLDPGEGYIGPTENLIHDWSTPGKKAPDVQFRVRGRFWPR